MAKTSNLIQRKGRWYFNRAYPKDLWPFVGKAPFRLCLGTDSMEEAQRQRGTAEQRFWAAVDEARSKLGDTHPRALTENEAVAIVFRSLRKRNEELHNGHLPLNTKAHAKAFVDALGPLRSWAREPLVDLDALPA